VGGDGLAGVFPGCGAVSEPHLDLKGLDGMLDEQTRASNEVGQAASATLSLTGGGQIHESGVNAHAGGNEEVPAAVAVMAGGTDGDLPQANGAGTRVHKELGGKQGIARQTEVLRDDVSGAEGQNAQRGIGSGDSLEDLEDGAIATADQHSIEPGGNRFTRLIARRLRGEGFLEMDGRAAGTQQLGDLLHRGTAPRGVDQQRIEEDLDAAHQVRVEAKS